MWIVMAALSAVFAGLTSILGKCGVKNADSDVVTAVRTGVVFVFSWIMVFISGTFTNLYSISITSVIFLVLSGLCTAVSWLCYYKALSLGNASKVAAVDKSSTVLSILFAIALFPSERNKIWLKLLLLTVIAIGTALMTDIRKKQSKENLKLLWFAIGSAVFAALTSILAKIGIKNVDSDLATALRTGVVLIAAWLIVVARKKTDGLKDVKGKTLLFVILSGIATGASWLCYYYAIQNGQVSIVVPIDKLSILITVIFSVTVFKEKLKPRAVVGLILLTASTLCMAIFT